MEVLCVCLYGNKTHQRDKMKADSCKWWRNVWHIFNPVTWYM